MHTSEAHGMDNGQKDNSQQRPVVLLSYMFTDFVF